jgi:hypothetical protein
MIKEFVISPHRDSPENGVPIHLVAKCTRCLVCYPERLEMSKNGCIRSADECG